MKSLLVTLVLLATAPLAFAQTSPTQTTPPAPPDPAHMSRQALRAEVTTSRAFIQNGAVQPQRPDPCTSPESRQFDFWVGDWDVTLTGQSMTVAESTISMEDQGCTLIEFWRPFQGAHGHSINAYDRRDMRWHQMWVATDTGVTNYAGRFEDGIMRFEATDPPPSTAPPNTHSRMSYQQIDANTVRQWGERKSDRTNGQWVISWDYTYHRRPGSR